MIWWVFRFFMSGASSCLTLYVIQAIKLPLTGLAMFLLSPTTVLIAFWEWRNNFNVFSFSIFLPLSCCPFLLPRAAQKQICHFKKLAILSFPCFGVSSLLYCAGVWFLHWNVRYHCVLLKEWEILGWASLQRPLEEAPATGSAPAPASPHRPAQTQNCADDSSVLHFVHQHVISTKVLLWIQISLWVCPTVSPQMTLWAQLERKHRRQPGSL